MTQEFYEARLAGHAAMPTLRCGRCDSTLSKTRIFPNEGGDRQALACHMLGLCSADDCRAVNCCDAAFREIERQQAKQKAV